MSFVVLDVFGDLHGNIFVFARGHGFRYDDKGFGDLAVLFVRDGYYSAVVDGWVAEEVGFELGGGDLVALGGS